MTKNNSITFISFGDSGSNTLNKYKISNIIKKNNINKIILLGDNFYDNGIESEFDKRWKLEYEDLFPNSKIYSTLGNHCYLGNIQAQINYSKINKNWILPSRYYDEKIYFDKNNYIHLISIDTFEIAKDESIKCSNGMNMNKNKLDFYIKSFNRKKQLDWLDNILKNSKAKWKIVYGHYPIFSNGLHHGNCKEMIEHVLPILLKYNVNIYLSGHDHNICCSKYKNLYMIVSGNGSNSSTKINNHPFFYKLKSCNGVCYLKFNIDKFEFGFLDLNGNIIFNISS
jgi:hypothetical protein